MHRAGQHAPLARIGRALAATTSNVLLALLLAIAAPAQAQLSVGAGGSPSYAHPISVPPGIAGLQPNLALVFAGGGVNGPVGHGWSLQGVSMITRCPATRYTDGASRGVRFDADDKLCLDGQRLIQTDAAGKALATQMGDASGLSDKAVREFRTEKDSFARVRAYGETTPGKPADGPRWFRVWTKAGQIFDYGNPPDTPAIGNAAVAVQGRSTTMVWAVARVADVVGNTMDFRYEVRDIAWGTGNVDPAIGREWNVVEIVYTGNRTLRQPAANKVVFTYEDRSNDRAEAWQQGAKNVSIRRLQRIETWVGSPDAQALGVASAAVLARRFVLRYSEGGGTRRSRLASITECADAAETTCLPPASFTYSAGGDERFVGHAGFAADALSSTTLYNAAGLGVITGDFDGDGRTDLLRWGNDPSQNALWLSQGDGRFEQVSGASRGGRFNLDSVRLFHQPDKNSRTDACFMTLVVDLNGDGIADLLRWATPTTKGADRSACPAGQSSRAFISKGDGSFTDSEIRDDSGATLALQRRSTVLVYCASTARPTCWGDGFNFFVGDFDGDGRADLIETSIDKSISTNGVDWSCPADAACYTRVRFGKGDGSFGKAVKIIDDAAWVNPNSTTSTVFTMDVDGDGLADLVLRPDSHTGSALLSNGDGSFRRITGMPPCAKPVNNQLIDLNGDGRVDFMCIGEKYWNNRFWVSTGAPGFFASRANGDGTDASTLLVGEFEDLMSSDYVPGATTLSLDLNGDGRTDLLRLADDRARNVAWLSNGDGTFRKSGSVSFDGSLAQLQHSSGSHTTLVGDFLGNGSVQLLQLAAPARNSLSSPVPPTPPGSPTTPTPTPIIVTSANLADPFTPVTPVTPVNPDDPRAMLAGATAAPTAMAAAPRPAATAFSTNNVLYVKADPTPPDVLLSVTSPSNLKTTLTWGVLTDTANGRYASDRNSAAAAVYPLIDVTPPMRAVTAVEAETGVGSSTLRTEFGWHGLKAAQDGRGLLGFRQYRQQNPAPGNGQITVWTEQWLEGPYAGVARSTQTRRGRLNEPLAPVLSTTVNVYCDRTSTTSPNRATEAAPCTSTALVKRPYLLRSVETGNDLDGSELPTVTTENTFDDHGNTTRVVVTTSGSMPGIGTVVSKQDSTHDFCAPDTATCANKTVGDQWVLGRLGRSKVTSSVTPLIDRLAAAAGAAPAAAETTGNDPKARDQRVDVQTLLSVITQLLLLD